MTDPVEAVARVRASVAVTRAEGTAALRFVPCRIHVEPTFDQRLTERAPALAAGVRALAGVTRAVTSRLRISELDGPVGRIDFVNDRSLYCEGDDGWTLTAPGLEFVGEPGEWERIVADDDTLLQLEPFWLLELIAASAAASEDGHELVLAAPCTRYRALASITRATMQAKRPMESPSVPDSERISIDVWSDAGGRIRRAVFHGDQQLTMLELSNFGRPDPIELPGPDQILPDED